MLCALLLCYVILLLLLIGSVVPAWCCVCLVFAITSICVRGVGIVLLFSICYLIRSCCLIILLP